MLYLDNTTEPQTLDIPAPSAKGALGNYTLHLKGTETLRAFDMPAVDEAPALAGYYRVTIALPEGMESGEYLYSLTQQATRVAYGVARIEATVVNYKERGAGIKFVEYEG